LQKIETIENAMVFPPERISRLRPRPGLSGCPGPSEAIFLLNFLYKCNEIASSKDFASAAAARAFRLPWTFGGHLLEDKQGPYHIAAWALAFYIERIGCYQEWNQILNNKSP
jgi:hypothetical protein